MRYHPANQGPKLERNSQVPTGGKQPDDVIFYNVMPRVKSTDTIVEPTVNVVEAKQGPGPQKNNFLSILIKIKLYIILGAAVLIGGPLVYFGINKFFGTPKQKNLLINTDSVRKRTASTTSDTNATTSLFTVAPEWRTRFFGDCKDTSLCGDQADPDHDGLTNSEEYQKGTDPNNKDSDQDGLADGDEVKVFESDPLSAHTAGNPKYTDADYIRGGYDFKGDGQLTPDQIKSISDRMTQYRLHQPTLTAIGNILNTLYNFSDPDAVSPATSTPESTATTSVSSFDQSLGAKQDRDAQRTNTIKNIGIALVKYQTDIKGFPQTGDFMSMYNEVKPYIRVATKPQDPINQDPFAYTYTPSGDGKDFTLTFYSEVAAQIIKKHFTDSQKDMATESAAIYDDQRKTDLESLKVALLLYSNDNVAGNQDYVFPMTGKYRTAIVPKYIGSIPKDPESGKDYEYQVSETFNTFTLKAILDNPSPGTTGYLCNQEECRDY
jgi:hypothetical protein